MHRFSSIASLGAVILVTFCARTVHAQSYFLTDLGTFSGLPIGVTIGEGITDFSQIGGYGSYDSSGYAHAFRSSVNPVSGSFTDLGTLGGHNSLGYGINNSGEVVGESETALDSSGNYTTHAFRSSANSNAVNLTDLGTLGGANNISYGRAINTSGQVAGESSVAGGAHAFRSSVSGIPVTLTDLGTLGGTYSFGYGINDSGQVTGESYTGTGQHAFRSSPNDSPIALTDLGTLDGGYSSGYAINAIGQVTGKSDFGNTSHAFRSSANGSPVSLNDLGTLGTYSQGNGINNSGVVVGDSSLPTGYLHAFVYTDAMHDLNDLVTNLGNWTLSSANGINDAGQITGYGYIYDNTFANPDARTCAIRSWFRPVGHPTAPIYAAISSSEVALERP